MRRFWSVFVAGTVLSIGLVNLGISGASASQPKVGTVDGNVTTSGGVPLNGVCLNLYNTTYTTDEVQFAASGQNLAAGAFSQANVPDGTYIGIFNNCGANTNGASPDYNYESIFYGNTFVPRMATKFRVTTGATVSLGTNPIPLGGTVSGTVEDSTADVPAYPMAVGVEIPGASGYNLSSPFSYLIVCTNSSGFYSVSGVPTTGVKIVFSPDNWACPNGEGEYNYGFYVQKISGLVSVSPDGTTTLNARVVESSPSDSPAARSESPCLNGDPCRAG